MRIFSGKLSYNDQQIPLYTNLCPSVLSERYATPTVKKRLKKRVISMTGNMLLSLAT